jgi:restriction endonuclease Mrr
MAMLDYQELMLPLLKIDQGRDIGTCDATTLQENMFNLTEEERQQALPSGRIGRVI